MSSTAAAAALAARAPNGLFVCVLCWTFVCVLQRDTVDDGCNDDDDDDVKLCLHVFVRFFRLLYTVSLSLFFSSSGCLSLVNLWSLKQDIRCCCCFASFTVHVFSLLKKCTLLFLRFFLLLFLFSLLWSLWKYFSSFLFMDWKYVKIENEQREKKLNEIHSTQFWRSNKGNKEKKKSGKRSRAQNTFRKRKTQKTTKIKGMQ